MGRTEMIRSGKMTTAYYTNVHYWIKRQLGKPSFCVECGSTTAKRYDWANISGEYKKEISDWQRMCRQCHTIMDIARPFCKRGHAMEGENIWIRLNGCRECKACKKLFHSKAWLNRDKTIKVEEKTDE